MSENIEQVFGIAPAQILDRGYLGLFDHEHERKAIEDSVQPSTILFSNPALVTIGGKACDAVFHVHAGSLFIEIERRPEAAESYGDMAMHAAHEMFDPAGADELYQRAVDVVRETTGYDRVMLYRFDPRFNGQVIAESKRDGMDSFLGMFFPATDIPARMRELYLKNFTRYIPDISAPIHRLVGTNAAASPFAVDMTHANLRSVRQCHIDYLQNMGVRGSMSFSINVDGKLWGLFACHHYTPRLVSYERRVVCEQAAMMFIYKLVTLSSAAARLEQRRTALTAIRSGLSVGEALVRRIAAVRGDWSGPEAAAADTLTRRALEAVYSEVSWLLGRDQDRESPPVATGTGLTEGQQLLLSLVEADSAAVLRGGRVYRIGDGRNGGAPSEMSVYAIASMFGRELPDLLQGDMHVFATDCLSAIVPAAVDVSDRAAGVLAVALSLSSPTYLLWFRREQVVHATWAGNPNARAPQGTASGLNPRASFEAWKQDIRNMSRSWELLDVQIADELADAIRGLESGRVAPAHPAPVAQPVARPHPFINQGALQQPSRRIVRISSY